MSSRRPLHSRFDYIYFSSGALQLRGLQPPLTDDRYAELLGGRAILPNAWFPSDHLPVAAALEWPQADGVADGTVTLE